MIQTGSFGNAVSYLPFFNRDMISSRDFPLASIAFMIVSLSCFVRRFGAFASLAGAVLLAVFLLGEAAAFLTGRSKSKVKADTE